MHVGDQRTNNPQPTPKIKKGDTIRLKDESQARRSIQIKTGQVIAVTDVLFVLKMKSGVKESFKFSDFGTGILKILG